MPVFASTALLTSTLVTSILAVAETVYIRDDLYVPLRGGQTSGHRILHKGLRSGTPMEHLEENPETGYTHVRLEGGMEGWLQTQYIIDQPIARDLLEKATSRLAKVEQDDKENKTRLRALEAERAMLFTQDQNLNDENQALQSELQRINDLAANVLNIEDKNQLLQTEQSELKGQIEELLLESEELKDDSSRAWFLRGAGTILIGLLFGFIVARRIYHRQAASGWV
ncbi:MAG: SH3 domain protein [Candidatus Azotimanducaceae bacterium]